jgi:small subunit ribosomal protein S9
MATTERYTEAVGRRKTSVARVRLTPAAKFSITANDKEFEVYFPSKELQKSVTTVFDVVEGSNMYMITAHLIGGGINGQAEALRLAIARALIDITPLDRTKYKVKGYLKRDPRSVERKKFGLKKARKAPTWSKR